MNTSQVAFVALPLSCSTVPNWPVRANDKWDLHTVTSAIAGFALHIGHTFLMIKAVKFTEHLLLVERGKKKTFFVLLVFSSFTIGTDFWWVLLMAVICQSHFRSMPKASKAVLKQRENLVISTQVSWISSLWSLFVTSPREDWLIET